MALAVGDIFAIIDKSWALYKILSDSRSSSTQYRDLKNQLRSLYAVLLSVKEVHTSGHLEAPPGTKAPTPDEAKHAYSLNSCIATIVQNCADTLDQLYEVFHEYRILGVADDSGSKSFVRVKQFFQKKEKQIRFTTEKEDLDSLRIQVQLHTNSLGVLLNLVINSQAGRIETTTSRIASQTARLEEQNREISDLVKEIHTAWYQSLQIPHGNSNAAPEGPPPGSTDTLFSIIQEDNQSCPQAVCDFASLFPVQNSGEGNARRLFQCRCDRHGGRDFSRHRDAIEAYALLDDTFSVRLAGDERTWLIYNVLDTATNRKVALRLNNIKASYMAIFEDIMADLTAQALPVMLQRQRDSSYFVYRPSKSQELCVLGTYSGLKDLVPKVESVSLSIGGQFFLIEESVSTLNLLQYDNIPTPEARPAHQSFLPLPDKRLGESASVIAHESSETHSQPPEGLMIRRPQGYSEMNFRYSPESEGSEGGGDKILELNVIFTKDTSIAISQRGIRNASVTVQCVHVDVAFQDKPQKRFDQADFEVHFSSSAAAISFRNRLNDMQTELKVLDLVQPRQEETTKLHLSAVKIDCDDFRIPDADFTVLRNPEDRYRLIVASRNRCTIISQELVPDFFEQARKTGKMNFASLAHVVQISNGVRTLTPHPHGLQHLSFERGKGKNMLEIACNTLLLGN